MVFWLCMRISLFLGNILGDDYLPNNLKWFDSPSPSENDTERKQI